MKTRNTLPECLWWLYYLIKANKKWQFGRVIEAVDLKSNVFALVGSKLAIVEILLLSCGNRLLTLSFCALNIKYLNSIQMYVHKHTCQHLNRIATQRIKTYNSPLFCFISMLRYIIFATFNYNQY